MGAILSICGVSQLACCATSTACSCLSCITPAIGAKIMYSLILLLVTITGWIMTLSNVSEWLKSKLPFCWTKTILLGDMNGFTKSNYFGGTSITDDDVTKETICEKFTGYLAVYRLMFATFSFFVVFGFIMIKVRSNRDPRVSLHRGFWFLKFLLLILGIVGAFYIPGNNSFGIVWKNFGFIGSFLYLSIQVCFLILFADEWANDWVNKMEEGQNGNWHFFALLSVSLLNYGLTILGFVLFYIHYGGHGCGLHNWLISINLIFIFALLLLSIMPKIQEYNSRSGLLQSSIIAVYLTYLTWSALNSSPDAKCKPTFWSTSSTSMNWQSFISLLICFLCVVYSSIRLSSREGMERITGISNMGDDDSGTNSSTEVDNYSNWPYFYWFLALGTLYLMMTLTNWFTPTESYKHFGESSSSLWIKMISSWFSGLIYLWALLAPVVLHEYRDFS